MDSISYRTKYNIYITYCVNNKWSIICGFIALLVCILYILLTPQCSKKQVYTFTPCSNNFIWYNHTCYYYSVEKATWNESVNNCIALNATLLIIRTLPELTFVSRKTDIDTYWIGLSRLLTDIQFKWIDNTVMDLSLTYIMKVPPPQLCGVLANCVISPANCSKRHKYICNTIDNY